MKPGLIDHEARHVGAPTRARGFEAATLPPKRPTSRPPGAMTVRRETPFPSSTGGCHCIAMSSKKKEECEGEPEPVPVHKWPTAGPATLRVTSVDCGRGASRRISKGVQRSSVHELLR